MELKVVLFLYQKNKESNSKTTWNPIDIGPKKAQIVAKSVIENNPKILVTTTSNCCRRIILEKAIPKLTAVKKI
jgi:hypothetical protein